MERQYVIKPDNRSLRVFKGIEEISFSFPVEPLLEEAVVAEIMVDSAEASWTITLVVKKSIAPEAIRELEAALCPLVLGLKKVKIKLLSLAELAPLPERLEQNWGKIINYCNQKFAGMSAWLLDAKYQLTGAGVLEILVRNHVGVDYLSRRGEEIGEIIKDLLWEEVPLSFGVGDFSEKILAEEQQKAEEEDEARQAFLKQMQASQKKELNNTQGSLNGNGGNKMPREAGVLLGRKFSGLPTPLKELYEEEDQVIVCGEVFRLESRTTKTNKKFYIGDVTDYQDSITFKIFPRGNNGADLEAHLKVGSWFTMRGNIQFDTYARELVLMVADLLPTEPQIKRTDEAAEKRIELHLHTKMSAMDATADMGAAVKLAAQFGHKAVAITDHGVVHSFPEVYKVAKNVGINVIYGLEGYLVDDGVPIVNNATNERLTETEFVVFDVETTGFNPWKEELLEIGAVKVKQGEIIADFKSLIKPTKEIPAEIQKLTGITPELVQDAPDVGQVLAEFQEFCGSEVVLVAHNARFDVGFLKAKYQQLFDQKYNPVYLDTLGLARAIWKNFKNYKLNTLAKELGISLANHHRAVDDAACTAQILVKALGEIAGRHFQNLGELNALIKESGVEHLRTNHIILLVTSAVGMRNLYELVSKSHVNYFHRHPRLPRSELIKLREGLLIGAACEAGEFYQAILDGAPEEKIEEIASFYDYLEIQPLANNQFLIDKGRLKNREELQEINQRICQIGAKLGKPVVATGDVHFLHPYEEIYRRVLLAGQGFEDANKGTPLYFRTTEEMLTEFSYLGKDLAFEVVVKNTNWVFQQVGEVSPLPDKFYPPEIEGAETEIREMSYTQATELYGDPLPDLVKERLEWELKSIIGHGYAVLYLTSQKLVKKSLDDGYLVGSRGSVGSSFVATMCNITEVNPLPAHYRCPECRYSEFKETGSIGSGYDLPDKKCPQCRADLIKDGQDIPFATFMGFEGDKEPDIDLNFSGDYQPKVHRYTEELFGEGSVYRAGTVTGLAEKMAFGFVKGYMEENGIKLRQAEINRLVKGCTGVRRSTGQHPGGMYVIPKGQEVYNFTPVQYPANDKKAEWITTHFDYHGALEGRLVKLDILGHDDPTVIRMLHDLTGIDPRSVAMDDPKTMEIFSSINSLGLTPQDLGFDLGSLAIPEFGTGFVRQMLEETKPTTFSELIYISGLSHGTDVWLGNAQELIRQGTATLKEVICTRDDIMNYLIFKGLPAKSAFKIMEKVRKGKGLVEDEITLMKEHEVPDWYIESCLKIKYMFPKAHAVAYVMMAFRIAYFKVHHPESFYATYFSVRADEFDADIVVQGPEMVRQTIGQIRAKGNEVTQKEKNMITILEVVLEAMLRGINFLRVDLYRSAPARFQITPEGLLPPLAALQGLGENAAQYIAVARQEEEFISIEDLKSRARLTSAVIEVLLKHGCLKGLPETDQLTLF